MNIQRCKRSLQPIRSLHIVIVNNTCWSHHVACNSFIPPLICCQCCWEAERQSGFTSFCSAQCTVTAVCESQQQPFGLLTKTSIKTTLQLHLLWSIIIKFQSIESKLSLQCNSTFSVTNNTHKVSHAGNKNSPDNNSSQLSCVVRTKQATHVHRHGRWLGTIWENPLSFHLNTFLL